MQGSWSEDTANGCAECSAVFSDYTVRLRYQRVAGEPLVIRNVCFESIDELRHLLLMYDNGGAWGYGFPQGKEGGRLDLEFYSIEHHARIRVELKRTS